VREQVFIEAMIIEVKAESGWSFGIDWMLGNQSGSNYYGGAYMNSVPNFTSTTVAGKSTTLPLSTGFQLGFVPDSSILAFALLNASGSDNTYNILSTPQLLTVDNEEAELNVGEEIPVASNNRISDSGTQFYTYEYKSVGIKLKITPHITNSNRITLDLYQEINSVLGSTDTTSTTSSTVPPTLGKRDIKTKLSVLDGKTIVVGGLMQNNKTEEETKVPLLGDIPLLGWFFKHKTVSNTKTNLLVFITPHIVTKEEQKDALTDQKRESQRRIRIK
jgi:general secretion pathway protein D